jgi:hypothetical protein
MKNYFIVKYFDKDAEQSYYIDTHQECAKFVEEMLNNENKIPASIEEFFGKKLIMEYKINATVRLHWTKKHEEISEKI